MEKFKQEIIALCEKHNMFISHEDSQGGFLIVDGKNADERYQNILKKWFLEADLEER